MESTTRSNVACSCSYSQPLNKPLIQRRASLLHTGIRRTAVRAFENSPDSSYDDRSVEREFEQVSLGNDAAKLNKLAEHLDLVWKLSQRKHRKPEQCGCCHGSGLLECTWCHGTGALTIGDTLFCSNEGCRTCPVCKGTGDCTCDNCKGTGKLASWLPSAPLH